MRTISTRSLVITFLLVAWAVWSVTADAAEQSDAGGTARLTQAVAASA